MKPNQDPTRSPTPDIEPIPGSLPKKFPNQPEPLSSEPRVSSPGGDDDTPVRSGSGEDPQVESGRPDNDPEQPKETDGKEPMQ